MKKTEGGYRAMLFEHLVLVNSDGGFTKCLYAIEGFPGIFRRLSMEEDGIRAWYNGGLIRLARAEGCEKELAEAGFVLKETAPLFQHETA